jgi:hypothetical protein
MLALICPFYSWQKLSLRLASATDKFILIQRVIWSIVSPRSSWTASISLAFDTVKSDLHRSFDHMGWFLLPELHVIQEIFQFTVAREGRTYKEVYTIQLLDDSEY